MAEEQAARDRPQGIKGKEKWNSAVKNGSKTALRSKGGGCND